MSLSGTSTYTMTAGEIVTEMYDLTGVRAEESPLESYEIQKGLRILNLMFKAWQATNVHLWKKEQGALFPTPGVGKYTVGPNAEYATNLDDFVSTELTADAASGATSITVTSTAGISANDKVGVKISNSYRFWTTIASVDSTTQLTLSVALTSAATSGNSVFSFTDAIERPLYVSAARRSFYNVDSDIDVTVFSNDQYFEQVNKTSQGSITRVYYQPKLTDGLMYIHQTPSSVDQYLKFTYAQAIQDINSQADNVDFPAEWLEGIIYNGAMRLGISSDCPREKWDQIVTLAVPFYENVIQFDEEKTSFNIVPTDGDY